MSSEEQLQANRDLINRAIDNTLSKRPAGWDKKSVSSYFNNHNAQWMIGNIKKMMDSRKELFFDCKVFNLSLNSLYHKVNQSIRFMIERLDKDRIYSNWYSDVVIRKEKGAGAARSGVRIFYRETGVSIEPELVEPELEIPRWHRKMDEWLESNDVEPFIMEGLNLTSDMVSGFKKQLSSLGGIEFSVTSNSIKIIRV